MLGINAEKRQAITLTNALWGFAGTSDDAVMRLVISFIMTTSSNGNIFRVTGPLCGEFTGYRWIPLTKASDTELWYFLWSAPE